MSFKTLGNKQTIILHNCEINNQKYDLVITPHTQTVGYIRTKRQTIKKGKLETNKDKSHEKDFQKIEKHFLNQKSIVRMNYTNEKNQKIKTVPSMINYFFPTQKQLQIHQKEEKEI